MFDINIDVGGSTDILKILKEDLKDILSLSSKRADVGVFHNHDRRHQPMSGGKSNVEIAKAHEFGSGKVPKRSFLLKPITDGTIENAVGSSNIDLDKDLLSKVASIVLDKVKEEIDTNGHGQYPPLSEGGYKRRVMNKNREELLRDTRQLYDSITFRVLGARAIWNESYGFNNGAWKENF